MPDSTCCPHARRVLDTLRAITQPEHTVDFTDLPATELYDARRLAGSLYHQLAVAIHVRDRPRGAKRCPPLPVSNPSIPLDCPFVRHYEDDAIRVPPEFVACCDETHEYDTDMQAVTLLLLRHLSPSDIHPLLARLTPRLLHDLDCRLNDLLLAVRAVRLAPSREEAAAARPAPEATPSPDAPHDAPEATPSPDAPADAPPDAPGAALDHPESPDASLFPTQLLTALRRPIPPSNPHELYATLLALDPDEHPIDLTDEPLAILRHGLAIAVALQDRYLLAIATQHPDPSDTTAGRTPEDPRALAQNALAIVRHLARHLAPVAVQSLPPAQHDELLHLLDQVRLQCIMASWLEIGAVDDIISAAQHATIMLREVNPADEPTAFLTLTTPEVRDDLAHSLLAVLRSLELETHPLDFADLTPEELAATIRLREALRPAIEFHRALAAHLPDGHETS